MGATHYEIKKLQEIIDKHSPKNVLQFGEQTNYATKEQNKPPFLKDWFEERGVWCKSLDLAGDNGAMKINWSYPIEVENVKYWMVTDFGSGEHSTQKDEYVSVPFHDGHINSVYPKGEPTKDEIEKGFYWCWKNKHNLLKEGGIMFNVNPLTGHWGGHGYSYLGEKFYHELVEISGYELIETEVICASGNCETGKNIVGIIKKVSEDFPSFEEFYNKLPIYKS